MVKLLCCALLCASVAHAESTVLRRVDLLPLGQALPAEDVRAVQAALSSMYGVEVRVRPSAPIPKAAWYAPRHRYRAEKILAWMGTQPLDGADRLLALTSSDISTEKGDAFDWGVLGLGDLDGAHGVLSTFRCAKDGVGITQARERFAKVAVHELGHTLGLPHCSTTGCIMHDAEGKVASTDGENDLCPRCRALLTARGYHLPVR